MADRIWDDMDLEDPEAVDERLENDARALNGALRLAEAGLRHPDTHPRFRAVWERMVAALDPLRFALNQVAPLPPITIPLPPIPADRRLVYPDTPVEGHRATCQVCQEDFVPGDSIVTCSAEPVSTRHWFHEECAQDWRRTFVDNGGSPSQVPCPVCRTRGFQRGLHGDGPAAEGAKRTGRAAYRGMPSRHSTATAGSHAGNGGLCRQK